MKGTLKKDKEGKWVVEYQVGDSTTAFNSPLGEINQVVLQLPLHSEDATQIFGFGVKDSEGKSVEFEITKECQQQGKCMKDRCLTHSCDEKIQYAKLIPSYGHKMTEEEIVKKVCAILGINYSHYDNHNMGMDYFHFKVSAKPKIVVYASSYGMWQFAILENMKVIDGSSSLDFLSTLLREKMKELGIDPNDGNDEHSRRLKEINEWQDKVKLAEDFLRENNCSEVINDKNKKINWV